VQRWKRKNLVLRQQVNVLRRRTPKRPHLNNTDRFLFVWLYRWFPSVLEVVAIARPETLFAGTVLGFGRIGAHRSLSKDTPLHRAIERLGAVVSRPALGGLHHQYCRI
jgi:hypothetical protein